VSDVLDGWYARTFGQATATGAVVDGISDKLFAAAVVLALVGERAFSWQEALLLASRELVELPLLAWWIVHRQRRREKAEDPRANWLGKAVTVLQFCAIATALFQSPLRLVALYLCALLGVVAALAYWRRELGAVR
jgi:phosphatidylglycerophosphate synthase